MKTFLIAALTTSALMFAGVGTSAADTTVTVTPADLAGGGWYTADTRPPGTGVFENGPATPPRGTGSFEVKTLTSPEKVQLFTDRYAGTRLAGIDGIGYSTYRDPVSTGFIAGVAALNIRVDLDGNGTADAYMVYEPYQDQGNAAVQTGVWQNWNAYNGGTAKWWINTGAPNCVQATPCTWSAILAAFPNATVREGLSCGPGAAPVSPCPGSLGVNQGSGNAGIVSNGDALYVSMAGQKTTYDFELTPPPPPDADNDGVPDATDNCASVSNSNQVDADQDGKGASCDTQELPLTKDDCKDGGWQDFDGIATFRNQGECVSFVNG